MKKSVAVFILSLLASLPRARAAVEATSQIRQYDDSRTRVTSPAVDVSGTFNKDQMKVTAGWAQDVLTSASADVKTFASKGEITEHRDEYSTSFETLIPDGTMSVGYIQSDEKDYHSRVVSAGATREFFQKNTVVGFGFTNGNDKVNSSSDLSFDKRMRHQVYSLSVSQVLSRVSLLQFLYDFRVENGFLASPYRRAKFIDNNGVITSKEEVHPQTRNRNAWAIKYNYFSQSWELSFATTYRLYQDSWGVLSHTIEERVSRELNQKWSVSLTVRYYTQGQANFYEDYYTDTTVPFRTGNNTLASYSSILVGVRPVYQINDNLSAYGKVERYSENFKNATDAGQLTTLDDDKKLEITALVFGVGLVAKF